MALDRLPAHYGNALEWKYIYGFSVEEIAGKLGVGIEAAQLEPNATRAEASEIQHVGDQPLHAFGALLDGQQELGVRRAVRVGTCGALAPELDHGDLLVAGDALVADGTSSALGAGTNAALATRSSAPKAAILVHAAMKAVMGVGAPW